MNDNPRETEAADLAGRLREVESRLRRLEERMGLAPSGEIPGSDTLANAVAAEPAVPATPADQDALEFELGQNWFAKVGILVLAAGGAFALSLPFPGLPAAVPSLAGAVGAGLLLWIALRWQRSFEVLSRLLRAAGLALLYFATLRLFFFGETHALERGSAAGIGVLLAVVAIGFTVALRQESPYLAVLALATGYASALVIGTPLGVLAGLAALAGFTAWVQQRRDWPWLGLLAIVGGHATYLLWMVNNPLLGQPVQWVTTPALAVYGVLLNAVLFAAGSFLRPGQAEEDPRRVGAAILNAGGAFTVFLLHAEACFGRGLHAAQPVAAAVLLALAIVFWVRQRSRYATFVYSMAGYMALSVAIIKGAGTPEVFVGLSLQSLLVVATAIWFRSRIIVVANFVIYLLTMAGYVGLAERETGVSVVFGVVALASARLLNWQSQRLTLRTEAMRNCYLGCAFAAFPYALYHLLPPVWVGLAWIGVAGGYYLLNVVLGSPKYRWMGHGTLLLTVLYVALFGLSRLEPALRILLLFVLGTALVVVSVVFTVKRARRGAAGSTDDPPTSGDPK